MKRTVLALALVGVSATASADNITRWLLGGTLIGAAVVALNQSVPNQQYYQPQAPAPREPYQSNVVYLQGPPNQQTVTRAEYPRQAPPPIESPRTKYIRECQRYGYTMDQCIRIWDGPPIQEPALIVTPVQ
jgi:hypothetical protein